MSENPPTVLLSNTDALKVMVRMNGKTHVDIILNAAGAGWVVPIETARLLHERLGGFLAEPKPVAMGGAHVAAAVINPATEAHRLSVLEAEAAVEQDHSRCRFPSHPQLRDGSTCGAPAFANVAFEDRTWPLCQEHITFLSDNYPTMLMVLSAVSS